LRWIAVMTADLLRFRHGQFGRYRLTAEFGSVYPIPDAPVLYFPYLLLAYLAIGAGWILSIRLRKPAPATLNKQRIGSILPARQNAA
jgi:hypothetical protein